MYRVNADAKTHITTWRETHRHLRDRHRIHYLFAYKKRPECFTSDSTLIRKVPISGVSFMHFFLASFAAFLRLQRSFAPDLIVCDQYSILYTLPLFLRRRRPALVLDLRHASYSNTAAWQGGTALRCYTRWILKLNRRFHDGITYISESLRQQLLTDMQMPLHPRHLIWPSGVDPDIFSPAQVRSPRDASADFNLFFHGSVTDGRGLAETISALPMLRERGVPAVFTIVGDGAFLPFLKDLARSLAVEAHVRFVEPVPYDEIPALIERADVCMMPYPTTEFWEGNVPIKLLEYMAMQKVVLTTPVKAFRAITRDCGCAHVVDSNEPANIAAGIEHLYVQRDRLADWGAAGREIVREHYTWRAIADDLDRFFSAVARDRSARASVAAAIS
jgi:glycosyltransferase involved in cell wall biosynthesis